MDDKLVKDLVALTGKQESHIRSWLLVKNPYEISAIRLSLSLKQRSKTSG